MERTDVWDGDFRGSSTISEILKHVLDQDTSLGDDAVCWDGQSGSSARERRGTSPIFDGTPSLLTRVICVFSVADMMCSVEMVSDKGLENQVFRCRSLRKEGV